MRSTAGTPLPDRITTYLSRSGLTDTVTAVLPLTGDASDRRYFRARRKQAPSIVFALHAEPFDDDRLPFVLVAGLFEAMPLPVPRILDRAGDLGILVLDDLGDVTLQAHLGAAPAAEHSRLYRQAVSFIEIMQRRGADLTSSDYPPYSIAFDVEKLLWELEFFTKHFLEAYRGAVIPPPAREALTGEWRALASELAAEPRVLCHRDYHSRNLMLHGGALHIIDFQDARLGPDTYDMVSLLRDSYVDLPDAWVDDLIRGYLKLGGPAKATPDAFSEYRRRFDLMSVQRNLKALGTFGHQTTARRNPVYIQYIPRTLSYVRTNLERYPRFARLREILF